MFNYCNQHRSKSVLKYKKKLYIERNFTNRKQVKKPFLVLSKLVRLDVTKNVEHFSEGPLLLPLLVLHLLLFQPLVYVVAV